MRDVPGLRFRPSVASDAAASAPLAYASGPDSFDYVFATAGGGAEAFLRRALAREGGEFGYGTHVVGELDGVVIACGAGWKGGHSARFWLATAAPVIAHAGLRGMLGAYSRGMQAESVMPGPERNEYYVGHLGVDRSWRGRGVGEALVAYLLAPPRVVGCRAAVLDVSAENPRAQALYERLGFRVTATRDSRFAHGSGRIPTHHRMEKELAA